MASRAPEISFNGGNCRCALVQTYVLRERPPPTRRPGHLGSVRDSQGYADISDYGFLSDCRSAALVADDGAIDWLCWPRFDSPALFSRLLDADRGGFFQIVPNEPYSVERRYEEGTNILRTTFRTDAGAVVHLEDWLHVGARHAICRLASCEQGEARMLVVCDPRPNFGESEEPPLFRPRFGYLTAEIGDEMSLILGGFDAAWRGERKAPGLAIEEFVIRGGEHREITLGLNRPGPSNLSSARRRAIEYWRSWSDGMRLPVHTAREEVKRSALVLKGLQYAPSGAIIAAPTTSVPEEVGGERNYDYRYTWLRDAAFTLYALRSVGRHHEAESFFDFLKSLALRHPTGELQILYGVGGESEIPELELEHLSGYRGSLPVRVGNHAATQHQLDTLGEIADAIALHHRRKSDDPLTRYRWLLVRDLAERAARDWRNPDEGIWEVRGPRQHFVYSKVQCWVALDRAIRLNESGKAPEEMVDDGLLERWKAERVAIKEEVLERGYDPELGAFTQYYGSGSLDAANLLLARVGFISPSDERFVNTVRATQRHLMRGGLVDRYSHQQTDDGFDGEEGTFTICTLWLVLALLAIGSNGEAEILFERVLSAANDLGLYSEELSPQGEQLGNFPQAFTHIALIVCAFAIDRFRQQEGRLGPEEMDKAIARSGRRAEDVAGAGPAHLDLA